MHDADPPLHRGAWIGAATSVPVIVLSLAGDVAASLPSPPYVQFEWLSRVLPGSVVGWGIDIMIAALSRVGARSTAAAAKVAETAGALALFVVVGAVFGVALAGAARAARRRRARVGAAGGVALFLAWALMLSTVRSAARPDLPGLLWLAALAVAWSTAIGWALTARLETDQERVAGRRSSLAALSSSAVAAVAAFVLGRWRRRRAPPAEVAAIGTPRLPATSGVAASPAADVLSARFAPPAHVRPELTPNGAFYRVDINLRPPEVDARAWRLQLDGLVETPRSFTLEEIRARSAVTQAITLECISNRVGGDLIGTSLWTGVRLRDLLGDAGLKPSARAVFMQAVDGFYETIDLQDAMDERTLLVYAMNGTPLAAAHGFPLRIYIPDRHGMKQPKWLYRLQAVDTPRPGYWVERGWSREAIVKTTSVVDTVETSMMIGNAAALWVGGIAYAGARGISRVEVQVDEGQWRAAELRAPPLGPLTWVQWRYAWPYRRGQHTFRVRAYDGAGRPQSAELRPPHPDGASGLHSVTTTV
jgi:DMSO/TMAO reductase YedYZ molybdopterin-dependent catalytic subunit